jgi:hypothetical protein
MGSGGAQFNKLNAYRRKFNIEVSVVGYKAVSVGNQFPLFMKMQYVIFKGQVSCLESVRDQLSTDAGSCLTRMETSTTSLQRHTEWGGESTRAHSTATTCTY